MNKIALAALPALAALAMAGCEARSPAQKPGRVLLKETKSMEWKGAYCGVSRPSHRVATTQDEWKRLWEEIGQPAPPADLKQYAAVAVFLGTRNTGGYGIAFADAAEDKSKTLVRYKETTPRGMAIQVITQPYAVRLYPRSEHPIEVEALPD